MQPLRIFPRKYQPALTVLAVLAGLTSSFAQTQPLLPTESRSSIDEIAKGTLAATGVPSASVAVVIGGKTAYLQAYGDARLEPKLPATPEMQYSVGSISKQFTAAAILLLQEQGKLSLDDHVSKYV
jgi:D-alanyl-D-alanine carboxypeptidase